MLGEMIRRWNSLSAMKFVGGIVVESCFGGGIVVELVSAVESSLKPASLPNCRPSMEYVFGDGIVDETGFVDGIVVETVVSLVSAVESSMEPVSAVESSLKLVSLPNFRAGGGMFFRRWNRR